MGVLATKTLAELDGHLVLAPERYDPRRVVAVDAACTLGDLVSVSSKPWRASSPSERVLVLDTSHAFEGVIRYRHSPGSPSDVGSTKRELLFGDVIVSRLRPYLRQVAFLDGDLFESEQGPVSVICSTEFYVLRTTDGGSVAFLVPYLLSPPVQAALAASQEGGHHPRVSRDAVMALPIPRELLAARDETSEEVVGYVAMIRKASRGLEGLADRPWGAGGS